jgi:hypothetical protein
MVCTAKLYDFLKVKKALRKSVSYVTQCTIRHLVTYHVDEICASNTCYRYERDSLFYAEYIRHVTFIIAGRSGRVV